MWCSVCLERIETEEVWNPSWLPVQERHTARGVIACGLGPGQDKLPRDKMSVWRFPPPSLSDRQGTQGRAGLGWAGLGWAGLGWALGKATCPAQLITSFPSHGSKETHLSDLQEVNYLVNLILCFTKS